MVPPIPSFEKYKTLVKKLKRNKETAVLAPGWKEIVDSINEAIWTDRQRSEDAHDLHGIYVALTDLTSSLVGARRNFREQFSFFVGKVESLTTVQSLFTAPQKWSHIQGIDNLINVVENIKMYDIDRFESGGLAALDRNALKDEPVTHEFYSHKITHLSRLVQTMRERKQHVPHLTYNEYILSLICLIAHEDERETSLTIERYFWNQSWTIFEDTERMLSRRFPSHAISGTPPRVYTNWALRDVFSSVTKAVWYTPDARVIDIRFKLVRAISELDLPLWPRSVNVPMDHPDALEATTFPPRRHNNDILLELEQAVTELVLLHKRHHGATEHSLSRFKPVSRVVHRLSSL